MHAVTASTLWEAEDCGVAASTLLHAHVATYVVIYVVDMVEQPCVVLFRKKKPAVGADGYLLLACISQPD